MEKRISKDEVSYVINSLGEDRNEYFNSVAPPIIQTSNFAFDTVDSFASAMQDEFSTPIYSRGKNPTVDILREKLAALDKAADCLVVNSGSTAIFVSVLSQVKAGDHIISVRGVYSWAQKMFDVILPRFGITTTYIDGRVIGNFEAAIKPNTRLIYLESPTSWIFEEQPLAEVARLAKQKGLVTIIDNTYFTPLYQKPVVEGIDIVLQSASKYIGGHSDTIGGVVSASAEHIRKIYESEFLNAGAGIMPFNAWLLLRGLRTLPARLERIRRTTGPVLDFLSAHPFITQIIAPANAFGLFTFITAAKSRDEISRFCEALHHIPMAVSWGGHESLVMPRSATISPERFNAGDDLHRSVRMYIGLEDADFIIADLQQALDQVS